MALAPVLVQKFGGTAVASPDARRRVVERIREARSRGNDVVVVVSAMGRLGEPYATDSLLELLGTEDVASPEEGIVAARDRDLLLACGEIIAAVILAHDLRGQGVNAVACTGRDAGVVTDDRFGAASVVEVSPDRLRRQLAEGRIPVVTGFQGVTNAGDVTTLGRGGSDTTAAVLAVSLEAEAVEFYKDVEGVYTADPKLVPDATLLSRITYREIVELAHVGARIVHPRAVEIAMHGRIPMRILPIHGPGGGTVISGGDDIIGASRPVTGVASVGQRIGFFVQGDEDFNEGLGLRIFEALAEARVSVDMIDVTPRRVGFIASETERTAAVRCLHSLGVRYRVKGALSKVSVAGAGMHGMPGVMARVMRALHGARVAVLSTTDSHANISCLVGESDAAEAVRALHAEFGLGDGGPTPNEEAAINEVG